MINSNSELQNCLNSTLFGIYTKTGNDFDLFCPSDGPLKGRSYELISIADINDSARVIAFVREKHSRRPFTFPQYQLLVLGEGIYEYVQAVELTDWNSFVEADGRSAFEFFQTESAGLLHWRPESGPIHRAIPIVCSSPFVFLGFSISKEGLSFTSSQLLVAREEPFLNYLFNTGFKQINAQETRCYAPASEILKTRAKNINWNSSELVIKYANGYSFPTVGHFFTDKSSLCTKLENPNIDLDSYMILRKWYEFWPRKTDWIHQNTLLIKSDFHGRLTVDHLDFLRKENLIVSNHDNQFTLSDAVRSYGESIPWNSLTPDQFSLFWTGQELWKKNRHNPIIDSKRQQSVAKANAVAAKAIVAAKKATAAALEEQLAAEKAKADAKKAKDAAEEEKLAAEKAKADAKKAKDATEEEKLAAEKAKADAKKAKDAAEEERLAAEKAKADAKKAKDATEEEKLAAEKAKAAPVKIKVGTEKVKAADLDPVHSNEDPEAEKNAITAFCKAIESAGWHYSLRDIVRFHTSVRCEPLTILGGASGSGKSSLTRLYAKYFGLDKENPFLQIDVQPSWHDRMDFLGFIKTSGDETVFEDAETGIASFLRRATGKNDLRLVCLEEINLARPEHYFADFLQRMSLPDNIRKDYPIVFWSGEKTLASFFLSENIRFVGTCNFDETTQNFSARFLDRCNYIEFSPRTLDELFSSNEPKEITEQSTWKWTPYSTAEPIPDSYKQAVRRLLNQLTGSKEPDAPSKATSDATAQNLLMDLGLIPSARTVQGMLRYVCARVSTAGDIPNGDKSNKNETLQTDLLYRAMDEAFVQRLFPKMLSSQVSFPGTDRKFIQEKLQEMLHEKYPLSSCFIAKHTDAF